MVSPSEETMRVHAHTRFCFLCVFTLLFHQYTHCHEGDHHHPNHHHLSDGHNHDNIHNDHQISGESYEGTGDHPETLSLEEAAEHEQQYYIKQLFRRYGTQNQLDFRGFENLLLSLGLGEVRVVELEHDGIGHDHVAHLDLLEVQEGKHSHSSGHAHNHAKHSHHHHAHTHEDADETLCSQKPSTEHGFRGLDVHEHDHDRHKSKDLNTQTQSLDHDHEHSRDHDQYPQTDHTPFQNNNHELDHEHLHTHPHDNVHISNQDYDHTNEHNSLDQDHHTKKPEDSTTNPDQHLSKSELHRHSRHHHHKHSHPHNHNHHTPDTTAPSNQIISTPALHLTTPATVQYLTPSQTPSVMPKRTRKPPKGRGQRSQNKNRNTLDSTISSVIEDVGNNRDYDHSIGPSHKGKRAVPEVIVNPNISSLADQSLAAPYQFEECLNLTQLLHHYGLNPDSIISPTQFTYLCPALLYQIDSRVCIQHYHHVEVEEAPKPSGWIWVWAFVSITVISLLSLLGVVLVPILNQACFKFLLTFLVALAVGTLSGDALLHLLPHSLGEHDHSHDHDHGEQKDMGKETDLLTLFDGVWKGLTALAGIYLLFIIEHCIRMIKHYKDQGGTFCRTKRKGEDGTIGRKLSDHRLNRHSDAEWMHLKRMDDPCQSETQVTELQPPESPSKTPLSIGDAERFKYLEETANNSKKKKHGHSHSHGHSHHGHCHSEKEMKDAGIASIAWMVIMGDGMHNFSDGLAIGAAFSANITGGISTSVAVFCHELPHELGDFAVLLKAGMTVKQAIVYNLLSALMAYFGMIIGTAVGQYTHNVTSWIFAITAGMFLYVALVDMLPEMLHGDSENHKTCQLGHFVLQNVGMLTGFTIMLLIAIFEDDIVIDLNF